MVLRELEAILSSHHFRGSKRYPALLRYIVEAALEQRCGDLKERTLGMEVFGRAPDYDTSFDPVVRISAGEVRKRIAQFYHENGRHTPVQIALPLGSYAPEFLRCAPDPPAVQALPPVEERAVPETSERPSWRSVGMVFLGALVLLAAGAYVGRHFWRPAPRQNALNKLWGPMFQTTRPVVIVLRTTPPAKILTPTAQAASSDRITLPYHYVSVSIALALGHLAGVLRQMGVGYEVKEAPETSLTDIRSRSVILVGAIDNDWTMRLTQPLRFHFAFGPDGVDRIVDAANPRQTDWTLDSSKAYSSAPDYAIVGRFHDPTVQGTVMVIAGLGPYGTEAAGEFVQSPQELEQLSRVLPSGWEDKNLELVLKTNAIDGQAGPPILLSAVAW